MIRLQDIVKTYSMGDRKLSVLKGVTVHVKKGEMVAIMGPSGCGKTTMLNIIGCLDRPTSGEYYLAGKEVSHLSSDELALVRGRQIGFVFQSFNLLPYLSAAGNVELGLSYSGEDSPRRAIEALARVGLADRARHRPSELSGGEQQRVAIARAVAKNPPLILADEPTGNLDSRSGDEIIGILTTLHTERNITLVMVTHDPSIARHCQRIVHMKDGQIMTEETV